MLKFKVIEKYYPPKKTLKVVQIMKENNKYLSDNGKWTDSRTMHIISNLIYKGDLLWGRGS